VRLSRVTPACEKKSVISASVAEKGKFPTNSFIALSLTSSLKRQVYDRGLKITSRAKAEGKD
jgi:hypothetical protein